MKEEDYRQICNACDALLNSPTATPERMAIAWLHVLNEHPVTLKKYAPVLIRRSSLVRIIKLFAWNAHQLISAIVRPCKFNVEKYLPQKTDIVLVSHFLNPLQMGDDEDFYFGRLAESLSDAGKSCLYVNFNHTKTSSVGANESWSKSRVPRVLLPEYLNFKDEIIIRWRLFQEFKRLRLEFKSHKYSAFEKRVIGIAAEKVFSPDTIATYRFYCVLKKVIEKSVPSAILVTYEGHAWERLAFSAARDAAKHIRCIGYQHAVIFPNQHSIKLNLAPKFNPEYLITAGEITLGQLSPLPSLEAVKILCIGTHRSEECIPSLGDKIAALTEHICLVIPDGTVEECITIFDTVFKSALLAPDILFLIRMHPVLPISEVAKRDGRLRALPPNVSISKKSITEDFEISRWALYRGTGASIRAVVAGIRPFYLGTKDEMPIDPLFKLSKWKRVVLSPEEFVEHMRKDMLSTADDMEQEFHDAREFCRRYFTPVDTVKFQQVILGQRS